MTVNYLNPHDQLYQILNKEGVAAILEAWENRHELDQTKKDIKNIINFAKNDEYSDFYSLIGQLEDLLW